MRQPIGLAIAGLGDFGSRFLPWQRSAEAMRDTVVRFCVDPNANQWPNATGAGIPCFPDIGAVPAKILAQTHVVVDCASKGQGADNLRKYTELGLPAVFQNGEQEIECPLYYEPLASRVEPDARYLRIIKCSAMLMCNIALALRGTARIRQMHGHFFKINNRGTMMILGYPSGKEVHRLLGIPTHVDRVYLRGTAPNQQPVYHGVVRLQLGALPSRFQVVRALATGENTAVVHDDMDTRQSPRGMRTLVVEESITMSDDWLEMMVIAHTPECNFPHLAGATHRLAATAN